MKKYVFFVILVTFLVLFNSVALAVNVFVPIGEEQEIAFSYNGIPFSDELGYQVSHTDTEAIHVTNIDLPDRKTDKIHFIQSSAFATVFPNGFVIGTIKVYYIDGTSNSINLVIGVNTAEWAYDRPDNQSILQHRKIPPAVATIDGPDEYSNTPYYGYNFYTSINTDEEKTVSHMQLMLEPQSYIIYGWSRIHLEAITLEAPSTVELESIEIQDGILIRDVPKKIWSKDDPLKLYPFAASMEQGTVKLHIELSDIINNYTPTVRCGYSWKSINGNPLTYQYPDEFEGWEGDIEISIPQGANLYDLNLTVMAFDESVKVYEKIIIDPEGADKGITVYITLDEPLQNISNPKEEWLEKATLWAQGSSTVALEKRSCHL